MARWLRLYSDHHDNPKISALTDHEYRFWLRMLCLAAKHNRNGELGTAQTVARQVPQRATRVQFLLEKLHARALLVPTNGIWRVHDWATWQYTSDVSTQRVRDHRKRFSNGEGNVPVTPPDYRKKDRLQTETVSSQPASVGRSREALPPSAEALNGHDPDFGQRQFNEMDQRRPPNDKPESSAGVFVSCENPAYAAWWGHLKQPAKVNSRGGWVFPSATPPEEDIPF